MMKVRMLMAAAALVAAAACQAEQPATETTPPADVAAAPDVPAQPPATQLFACGEGTRLSLILSDAAADVSVNEGAVITLARQGATSVYTNGAATLTVESPNVRFAQGAAPAETCVPAVTPATPEAPAPSPQ